VLIALDAALAELPRDPAGGALKERLAELRDLHPGVARAARAALSASFGPAEQETTAFALGRIEAALRARAAALAE